MLMLKIIWFQVYQLNVENLVKWLMCINIPVFKQHGYPPTMWYIHVLIICYTVYYIMCHTFKNDNYIVGLVCFILFGIGLRTYGLNVPFLNSDVGRGLFSFPIGLLIYEFQVRITLKKEKV